MSRADAKFIFKSTMSTPGHGGFLHSSCCSVYKLAPYKYILPLTIITLFELDLHSTMREVKKKKSIKKSIEKLQDIGFFLGV